MKFIVSALSYFQKQVSKLDKQSRTQITKKIQLIKQNPFRFKKVHSKQFSKVFRVRLTIHKKETRLIYVVISPNVILVCLLDRKGDYKDLEKYLSKLK